MAGQTHVTTPQAAENHEATSRHQDPWKALTKTREGLKEREDQTKSTTHRREEAERREKTSQERYNPLHNGFLVQSANHP